MKKTRSFLSVFAALIAFATAAETVTVDDSVLEYEIASGTAMVVRVTHRTGATGFDAFLSIPETIASYPVGFCADAFADFEEEGCILLFLGNPPTVVEDGAFPSYAYGYYPRSCFEAWKQAGTYYDDKEWPFIWWQDLYLMESPYVRTWNDLVAAVADSLYTDVSLFTTIVQPAGAEPLVITNASTVIDMNGHDIVVSNRFARILHGCEFVLCDHAPEKGAAVRFCNRTTSGAALHVASAIVTCMDITFIDESVSSPKYNGGAVYLKDCHGVFSGCRFLNCRGANGGAMYCDDEAKVALDDCTLIGNRAQDTGGAIYAKSKKMDVRRCTFTGNGANYASAIFSAVFDPLSLTDCVITNNALCREPVYVAGRCVVTNTLIAGNEDSDHVRWTFRSSYFRYYLTFSGGVLDALPEDAEDWVSEGFEPFRLNGYWSAAVTNTLVTNAVGQIRRGVFAFDPTGEPCASCLTLHPDAIVRKVGDGSPLYQVLITDGGPYTETIDGVTVTYRYVNGELYLGDGTGPAMSPVTGERVRIPAKVDGCEISGISANAFSSWPDTTEFIFSSVPPTTVADGAFPRGASLRYPLEYAEKWEWVIVGGQWNGLVALVPICDSWTGACKQLRAGKDVVLGCSMMASNSLALEDSSLSPTLDLCGYTVTVDPSLKQVLRLTGGAKLLVTDSVGSGGFNGGGQAFGSQPVFDVAEGTLEQLGGLLEDFANTRPLVRVGSNGVYRLAGGMIRKANGSAAGAAGGLGALIAVEDGTFELIGGGLANSVVTGAGVPLVSVSGAGRAFLRGGSISACAVAADTPFFSLLSDDARLTFYGTVFYGNRRGGEIAAVEVDRLSGTTVYGGAFDRLPPKIARGYEPVEVLQEQLGTLFLVARAGTVAQARGTLTAGEFTFDPTDTKSYAIFLPLPEPDTVNLTNIAGEPERWRFAVKYQVTCDTVDELRANVLVGNDAVLAADFAPDSPGKMPSGFVYRASVRTGDGQVPSSGVRTTLRLYETETGGTPLWTGSTNAVPDIGGVFQLWVDDGMRDAACTRALADVFADGQGVYLGVTFADNEECRPRRNLVSVPLVSRATCAAALASDASAAYVIAPTGTVTCGELKLADGGLCETLEITASNAVYNVSEMQVGGFTLYRHADNRILSSKDGAWTRGSVQPGTVLVSRAPTSGLLTIKSDDGDTVPLLTVPVPAGGSFTWQSTPFEGEWRWTSFGENN